MVESAGILAYRKMNGVLEFFLVHPGGPFFVKKDLGWWSIPKGIIDPDEDKLVTAKREFLEETGVKIYGEFLDLGIITQKGGKRVHAFAVEFDLDADTIVSNTFALQWPPGSGKVQQVPEVDRAGWFELDTARQKINERQAALLDRLMEILKE